MTEETSTTRGLVVAAVPAIPAEPIPQSGGRYLRDPDTGELVREGGTELAESRLGTEPQPNRPQE